MTFTEKVFAIVRDIPEGETMTYKEVALAAGNPGAARAVGNIMSTNYDPDIPCHRVVRSSGLHRRDRRSRLPRTVRNSAPT